MLPPVIGLEAHAFKNDMFFCVSKYNFHFCIINDKGIIFAVLHVACRNSLKANHLFMVQVQPECPSTVTHI